MPPWIFFIYTCVPVSIIFLQLIIRNGNTIQRNIADFKDNLMHKYQIYKIVSIRSLSECLFPYFCDKFSVSVNLSDKKWYFNLTFYDLLIFFCVLAFVNCLYVFTGISIFLFVKILWIISPSEFSELVIIYFFSFTVLRVWIFLPDD